MSTRPSLANRRVLQARPVGIGLVDEGGVLLEGRHAILVLEEVELAVQDRPGLRIGLDLVALVNATGAEAGILRRIALGIGDELGAMLGTRELIHRVVEGEPESLAAL